MRQQDFGDRDAPWTHDWKRYLTQNGLPPIVAAHTSCTDGRVTTVSDTVTDDGTSVTFAVSQSGITRATEVAITVHVTLDGGAELEQDFVLLFTNISR